MTLLDDYAAFLEAKGLMSSSTSIEIRGWLPPGLNGKLGLERMHWATKKKLRGLLFEKIEDWWEVGDGASYDVLMLPGQRRYAVYTRYSVQLMDTDNLASSCKLPL